MSLPLAASAAQLPIGIIGSGFIVSECHLPAYRRAGYRPVGIASSHRSNAERVAAAHGLSKVYGSTEELLDDRDLRIIDIAVPPDAQPELIRAACSRPHIVGLLAQKPLASDYAEARALVELCERAGKVLAVNQNMRFDPSVAMGKQLLSAGELGQPVFATIDMRGIPHLMPWQQRLGWVTLRIMSIHHLDTFRHWFGDPVGIFCSTRSDPRTPFAHTDGICTYILEYADGLRCVGIDDIWTGPAREGGPSDTRIEWRIEGTRGLAIGDLGWVKQPYTSPSTLRYGKVGDAALHAADLRGSWFPDAFAHTMGDLLRAVDAGAVPMLNGRDNLKTLALVEAAYLSAAQGRLVRLNEFSPNSPQ